MPRMPSGRPRLFASARVRILAAFVVLLAVSEVVAVVAERQILLARVGERVDDSLVQEMDEFRRLVRDGRNPLDGEPFGSDVAEIFDVFLLATCPARARSSSPSSGAISARRPATPRTPACSATWRA